MFRTAAHGPLDEDLRTGIADADYKVAFEIDSIDLAGRARAGACSSRARPTTLPSAEQDAARSAGVEPWAPGDRELFVRIVPSRITGRRVGPA